MEIEEYKRKVIKLVESSADIEYIQAVYSFVKCYPDKSKNDSIEAVP